MLPPSSERDPEETLIARSLRFRRQRSGNRDHGRRLDSHFVAPVRVPANATRSRAWLGAVDITHDRHLHHIAQDDRRGRLGETSTPLAMSPRRAQGSLAYAGG
jgi:hypothetical protein